MPTMTRLDNLRVVIYSNDHRPAHVHMIGPNGEVVYFLNCPGGLRALRESFGFKLADVNRIQSALAAILAKLCNEWSKLHGNR